MSGGEPAFYPPEAQVPAEKRTDRLLLRALRASHVDLDYDAVMSSAERLRRWSQSPWPPGSFSLAENLEDLRRHESEHLERKAFTFTVLDPQEARCLGCVYVMPLGPGRVESCAGAARPAEIGFWVRTSELESDLERHLLMTLLEWFRADWAFDCLDFSISPLEDQQAALFREAGLQLRHTFTTPDGRSWLSFS